MPNLSYVTDEMGDERLITLIFTQLRKSTLIYTVPKELINKSEVEFTSVLEGLRK